MQNPDRLIDKTYLSLDSAEERGLLHRDYLSHCLRWSHVVKFLQHGHTFKDAVVLDIGAGKELPLAKLLYVNKMSPLLYVGVDYNKGSIPEMLRDKKIPMKIWWQTNFLDLTIEDVWYKTFDKDEPEGPGCDDGILPDVVVCFECLEHCVPSIARGMLKHMQELTSKDVHLFISTPCFSGEAAGNHVNEMTFLALGALIEDLGFAVDSVHGTFASIKDYEAKLANWSSPGSNGSTDLRPFFESLRKYYDTNVLSVLFAPLFPEASRNCLWHLTKKTSGYLRKFSPLVEVPGPWSQHPAWRELAG